MFDHIYRYTADGNSIYGENTDNINELFKFCYVLFLVCKGMIKHTSNGCDEQYRDMLFNKPGLNSYQLGREARVSEGVLSVRYDTRQDH